MRSRFSVAGVIVLLGSGAVLPEISLAQTVPIGTPWSSGCGPGGQPPSLVCNSLPTLGAALTFYVLAQPGSLPGPAPAFVFFGICDPLLPPVPPIPGLCPAGPGGCPVALEVTSVFALSAAYQGSLNNCGCIAWATAVLVPPDPAIVGASICSQAAAVYYSTTWPACIAVSSGLSITILP